MEQNNSYSPETLEAIDLTQQAHLLACKEQYEDALDLLSEAEKADPQYAGAYIEEGNIHAVTAELDQAKLCYDKALELDPNSGELHYAIGNLKILHSDYQEAIKEFHLAEDAGYTDPQMTNNLGFCYQELGQVDNAMAAYIRASRENPEWVDPVAHRINLLIQTESLDEAESLCKRSLTRFPAEMSLYCLMIDILVEKDQYEEAEECLKVALEVFPEDVNLRLQKVRLYGLTGRSEEAHAEIASLREVITESESLDELDTIEAHILLGEEKIDEAIEKFKARISREEEGLVDVDARNMLMELYSAQKRYSDLLDLANECLKLPNVEEDLIRAIVLQPFALEQLGRLDEAMMLYKEALTRLRLITVNDSTRTEARVYRIMCLRGLKQYDQALTELERCEKLTGPTDGILTLRAQLLMDKGDKEEAKALADQLQEKARKTLGL